MATQEKVFITVENTVQAPVTKVSYVKRFLKTSI